MRLSVTLHDGMRGGVWLEAVLAELVDELLADEDCWMPLACA